MQIINILGDDRWYFASAIERGERPMATPGSCGFEGGAYGEAPPPRFVARLAACNEFIERDRPVAGPQSAGRAEIRDSAFGRNTGAGKRHDHGSTGDHLAELLYATTDIRSNHCRQPEGCSISNTTRRPFWLF